jgi:hypothetical protein
VDPISDGPGSSDEFQPSKEPEEEDDEEFDASEDENAKPPVPKPKPGRSKKLKKGSIRKAVDEERERQVAAGSTKRKSGAAEQASITLTTLTSY